MTGLKIDNTEMAARIVYSDDADVHCTSSADLREKCRGLADVGYTIVWQASRLKMESAKWGIIYK